MLDDRVRTVMGKRKLIEASPGTAIVEAARLMARGNVGAILVIDKQRLVGILSERDIVFRVVAAGLDTRTTRIAEVMTRDPQTVHPDLPFGSALIVMHEGGFRHLPVVEDGRAVGMVSSRMALDPALEEFAAEKSRREHFLRMRNAPRRK
jgi:CBS domain-containing protein